MNFVKSGEPGTHLHGCHVCGGWWHPLARTPQRPACWTKRPLHRSGGIATGDLPGVGWQVRVSWHFCLPAINGNWNLKTDCVAKFEGFVLLLKGWQHMSWSENSFWNWQRAGELVKINGNHRYLRDQPWAKTFHAAFMGRSPIHTSCLIFSIIFVIFPWFAEIEIRNDYCMSLELLETGSRGGAYVGMAGLLSLVIGGNLASEFITQKAVFAATQLTACWRSSLLEQWICWVLVFRLSQLFFRCILCICTCRVAATLKLSFVMFCWSFLLQFVLGLMLRLQVARNSLRHCSLSTCCWSWPPAVSSSLATVPPWPSASMKRSARPRTVFWGWVQVQATTFGSVWSQVVFGSCLRDVALKHYQQ